jgi:hypothetical protein
MKGHYIRRERESEREKGSCVLCVFVCGKFEIEMEL